MSVANPSECTLVLYGRVDRLRNDDPDYHAAVARLERNGIDVVIARGEIRLDHVARCSLNQAREQLKQVTRALQRLAEVRGVDFTVTLDSVSADEAEARRMAEAGALATIGFVPAVQPSPVDSRAGTG